MKRKKLIILVIIILLGSGTWWYFKFRQTTPQVTYQTSQVQKGTITSTVSGSGNIAVSESADINPSVSGTIAEVKVDIGNKVESGQTLFTIDNDQLDITVDKAYANFLQAQQSLSKAQSDLATARQSYNNQVQDSGQAKAQASYDQAKQSQAQSEYQLAQDQAMLEKYEDDNDDKSGTHSASDIDLLEKKIAVDQTSVTANKSNVASAKLALDQAKAGASIAVSSAKAELSAAETNIKVAETNLAAAEADYNDQKETAGKRTVTAPINGTVTSVNVKKGDQLSSSGSNNSSAEATSSTTPITIENLDSLKAIIQINEVDIAKVKVDQKSSLSFDAIDDLTLTGKVEKVDTVGTATQGVVSYSATIGFDSLDERVRPQMSVNATITTEVKQDVLTVASSAVKSQGDSYYVEILQNNAPVQQIVEIGSSSDTDTEIVSGLEEGASVITQTITAGQEANTNTSRGGFNMPGFGGGGEVREVRFKD